MVDSRFRTLRCGRWPGRTRPLQNSSTQDVKPLAAGAIVLGAFLLANVVAGGVFLVLWPIIRPADEIAQLVAAALLGALAVACAYFFIVGALSQIPRWLNRKA